MPRRQLANYDLLLQAAWHPSSLLCRAVVVCGLCHRTPCGAQPLDKLGGESDVCRKNDLSFDCGGLIGSEKLQESKESKVVDSTSFAQRCIWGISVLSWNWEIERPVSTA